ncbi:MAG TPA: amidohydrolase family protein [Stellaceae bacterium]|nr:amidohydrolase family protein [Stellaceae bacterium]
MTAIRISNVSVFDGSGAAPFPGEVLIEGERIKTVAKGSERIAAPGAEVIDGKGGTLMPGLIEPHTHLTFTCAVDRIVPTFMPPVEDHVFITAHNAKTILDHGYTSAFSGGATRPQIEVKLRDEIAKGFVPGPRLKAASFERAVDGSRQGYGQGVAEVEKFCREMIGLGVDSMKFILSGAKSVIPRHFDEMAYTEGEIDSAARLAKENGINLVGHAYSSESIRLAIRYGFRAIFHCNFADEPTLDLMEKHKSEFFVVPAVGIIEAGLKNFDEMAEHAIERQPEAQVGLKQIDEGQLKVIPAMRKRGIRVLPGGDYGFAHNPHGRNAWELELFEKKFGFGAAETLAAATSGGAALMGMGDALGQVKPGYIADLLIVAGDPVKNIKLLQDKTAISHILQGGKFYKRPEPARHAA